MMSGLTGHENVSLQLDQAEDLWLPTCMQRYVITQLLFNESIIRTVPSSLGSCVTTSDAAPLLCQERLILTCVRCRTRCSELPSPATRSSRRCSPLPSA